MKFLVLVFCTCFLHSYTLSELISDYYFTNQKFNYKEVKEFLNEFKKCKLDEGEINWITTCSYKNQLHPLIIITKLQQESDIIENGTKIPQEEKWLKAMGCRLYSSYTKKKREKYWGFFNQVYWGAIILRYNFEDFEYGNEIVFLYGKEKNTKVYPVNSATYSIYQYCPAYGEYTSPDTGNFTIGNKLFADIYNKYKIIWEKLHGKI